MNQPRYKVSKFQIVGNEEGKAVVEYEIIFNGETLPFQKPLKKGDKHDVDLLLSIGKFINTENYKLWRDEQ